ncbi:MAG: hypothetical protein A2Z98_09630 [Spirochaetes bacterium GWB1_27_13]|nr:MAG: hypothetical protein A2Z98_09630 [Spirochaetes bacterium GWB1_27_13]
MNLKKIVFVLILLSFFSLILFSQTTITASLNNLTECKTGDVIKLYIRVDNNNGLHGLYFDLTYDGAAFTFQDINQIDFYRNLIGNYETLYAYSDSGNSETQHLIISFTMDGKGTQTLNNGKLLEITFKVNDNIPNIKDSYIFGFNRIFYNNVQNYDVKSKEDVSISNVNWVNSNAFRIRAKPQYAFLSFVRPYNNQVIYDASDALVDLVCSKDIGSKIEISKDLSNDNFVITATDDSIKNQGYLSNKKIPITKEGLNKIIASLFDDVGHILAQTFINIFKYPSRNYIKIEKPTDHLLVNSDMVTVQVKSTFDNVKVNGLEAVKDSSSDTDKIYKINIWLKNGFNKIKAEVKNDKGAVFSDSIVVYYYKSNSIFEFTEPSESNILKINPNAELIIKGNIDSLYQQNDEIDGQEVENTVSINVTFYPSNPIKKIVELVKNKEIKITESDASVVGKSKYIFFNNFKIPLNGLSNGNILIEAFRNRVDTSSDGKTITTFKDKITRIVPTDDNRLWIDLVQPNVYTYDLLDSEEKIRAFNDGKTITKTHMELSSNGSFILSSSNTSVDLKTGMYPEEITESPNGDLYLLQNDTNNNILTIYKKDFNSKRWYSATANPKSGVIGYSICKTDIGLLIGTSNLFTSTDSGLFILNEKGQLKNVEFPEPVKNVQFVKYINGQVYLYGNNYIYLYKFNPLNLVEGTTKFTLSQSDLSKENFENSFNIKQLELTGDLKTAIIRDSLNNVYFYNKTSNGYVLSKDKSGIIMKYSNISYIVMGDYDEGEYYVATLVDKTNNKINTIMINKKTSVKVLNEIPFTNIISGKTILNDLIGISFKDNFFYFLYKSSNNTSFGLQKGQLFFGEFYPIESNAKIYTSSNTISINNFRMVVTKGDVCYIGLGIYGNTNLYSFYNRYYDSGSCEFNYKNTDIEAISGISFDVDPIWFTENSSDVNPITNIIIKNFNNTNFFDISADNIKKFIDLSNDDFVTTHSYNNNKEEIYINFKKFLTEKYINFKFDFDLSGDMSPSISNLKIHKKVKVKVCKAKDKNLILPIHGYIYDKTVSKVSIQNQDILLQRDGGFYYEYNVTDNSADYKINLSCQNTLGEQASLDFNLQVVDSTNDLIEVKYKDKTSLSTLPPQLSTTDNSIDLSGKFYGLVGCVVGYELYSFVDTMNGEDLTLEKTGVFDTTTDKNPTTDILNKVNQLGNGYYIGKFENKKINLIPGKQKIKIYCENPGGLRDEYIVDKSNLVTITYNVPPQNQSLVFLNVSTLTPFYDLTNDVTTDIQVSIDAKETSDPPYEFIKNNFEIEGYFNSPFKPELKIDSLTDGLTFSNGQKTIIVYLDAANRFKVTCNIKMKENCASDNYFIKVTPDVPSLSSIKKGLKITATKSFGNTHIYPDFSLISPTYWTAEQKANPNDNNIPIKLKFDRYVPDGAIIDLKINYQDIDLTGYSLVKESNLYYIRKNNTNSTLVNIKSGKNRIQWELKYNGSLISYSNDNLLDNARKDFVFNWIQNLQQTIKDTSIVFNYNPNVYYNSTNVPKLTIDKDTGTEVSVTLNNYPLYQNTKEDIKDFGFNLKYVKEGKNILLVKYKEPNIDDVTKEYYFYYDNSDPKIVIQSYKFNDTYKQLIEIKGLVTETNLKDVFLWYDTGYISSKPQLKEVENGVYEALWDETSLTSENIIPSQTKRVKLVVKDIAGKESYSQELTGFNDIQRPDNITDNYTKNDINFTPIYNNPLNNTLKIDNEKNFAFDHYKFAPSKYMVKTPIKDTLGTNNNYLIKNDKDIYAYYNDDGTFSFKDNTGKVLKIDEAKPTNSNINYFISTKDYEVLYKMKGKDLYNIFNNVPINLYKANWTIDDPKNAYKNGFKIEDLPDVDIASFTSLGSSSSLCNSYSGSVSEDFSFKSLKNEMLISEFNSFDIGNYTTILNQIFDNDVISDKLFRNINIGNFAFTYSDQYNGTTFPINPSYYLYYFISLLTKTDTTSDGSLYEYQMNGMDYKYVKEGGAINYLGVANDKLDFNFSATMGKDERYWYGYFIPENRDYTFEITDLDDAASIWINDVLITDSVKKTVKLNSGYTKIELRWDNRGGGAGKYKFWMDGTILNTANFKPKSDANRFIIRTFKKKVGDETYFYLLPMTAYYYNFPTNNLNYLPVNSMIERYHINNSTLNGTPIFKPTSSQGAHFILSNKPSIESIKNSCADLTVNNDDKKYIVFKVKNSPRYTDINNKIKFKFTYSTKNIANLVTENTEDLNITQDKNAYINGVDYFYYVVDIEEIKSQFKTKYNTKFMSLDAGNRIFDRGSLKIVYTDGLLATDINDIYLTGDSNTLLNDIIVCDNGYRNGDNTTDIKTSLKYTKDKRSFKKDINSNDMSLSFFFRIEDNDYANPIYPDNYKKILTLYEDTTNDQYLYFSYNKNNLELIYEKNGTKYSKLQGGVPLIDDPKGLWNIINLVIDKNKNVSLFVNRDKYQIDIINTEIINNILTANHSFSFGDYDVDNAYNSGFYSIAEPFYINRALTDEEIVRYCNLNVEENSCFTTKEYTFNFDSTDFFKESNKIEALAKVGTLEDSYYCAPNEDVNASVNSMSLNASSYHKNFISAYNNKWLLLEGASNYSAYNLNVGEDYSTEGKQSLTVSNTNLKGRYYFGDKRSNYGLRQNRWYSVSGEIENTLNGEVRVCLRINGKEQSVTLNSSGRFHLIYDNIDNMIPEDVVLYIETNKNIAIKEGITLNEGNYIIKNGLVQTSLKFKYLFDTKGSVGFWYKPIMSNEDGFVNYPSTLFDSEYIKISTVIPEGYDKAVFNAIIKGSDGKPSITLDTTTFVKYNWQYIQISYDLKHNIVYLYVDNKIAGKSEIASLPFYGSLAGIMPSTDNVYIGCDNSLNSFAEGYIDDLTISNVYRTNQYSNKDKLNIDYYDNSNELSITPNSVSINYFINRDNIRYEKQDSATNNISTSDYVSGNYKIVADAKINTKNFRYIYSFKKDKYPNFIVTKTSPIVFSGKSNDVTFDIVYDKGNSANIEKVKYAGVKLIINYTDNNTNNNISKTKYIVQDFQNQNLNQWIEKENIGAWTPSLYNSGIIKTYFKDVNPTSNITWQLKFFYYDGTSDITAVDFFDSNYTNNIIPVSSLTVTKKNRIDTIANSTTTTTIYFEYGMAVNIGTNQTVTQDQLFKDMSIKYTITNKETNSYINSGIVNLNGSSGIELYYDDIIPNFGKYDLTCDCNLELLKGTEILYTKEETLYAKKIAEKSTELGNQQRYFNILDFSLLSLNKEAGTAIVKLEYEFLGISSATCEISYNDNISTPYNIPIDSTYRIYTINNISVSDTIINLKAKITGNYTVGNISESITKEQYLQINNSPDIPEVYLTNTVNSLISYNNVTFSWKGYYNDVFNSNLLYSYNFDNMGWSSYSSAREVDFYNLKEGEHSFRVKAKIDNFESIERGVTFSVDINRPVFNPKNIPDLIKVENIYDGNRVLYAVNIIGQEGAIVDSYLKELYLNGEQVTLGVKGSFVLNNVPLTKDGNNNILLTAVDKVGNFTDYNIRVVNNITQLRFPDINNNIKYSPMSIVGTINNEITDSVNIYIYDPLSIKKPENEDYAGWKKATVNQDRTFFVENVFVNTGTNDQEIATTLKMVSIFSSGKKFEKDIIVKANEILMPIEMNLSSHSAEGQNSDTYVKIDCKANVNDISSWSIDFNGDGIYDKVDIIDNPDLAKTHIWEHKYSSLGEIKPRVRVITRDGNFFSVNDTLIIHEKIRQSSNKIVKTPLAMSSIKMPNSSNRIFVLRKENIKYLIDIYEIGRNDNYISEKLFSINLDGLIENPTDIKCLDNDHIFITSTDEIGINKVYMLITNEYGNYVIAKDTNQNALFVDTNDKVKDIACDENNLYISLVNKDYIIKTPIVDGIFDPVRQENIRLAGDTTVAFGSFSAIAKNNSGLLISDFYNQRIIRMSYQNKVLDLFGTYGTGEGEFVMPTIIKSYQNRIFVYDDFKKNIEVYDPKFKPICRLEYNTTMGYQNYLEQGFLNDLADIDIVSKVEENGIVYYALILSKTANKLAMLRLPQWEEMRAKVRNNKIVYLKNGEVFTAKPNGSDLTKIISTDSLPRIEGTLDYPALSSDGKSLLFTSRKKLYNGIYDPTITDPNGYNYDSLYVVDIETKELNRINLSQINGYEIERPVFNSNGDKLIFSAKNPSGGKWQIYIYNFKTKEVIKLFNSNENNRFPYFSPDDKFIVYTTDIDGDEEIMIVDSENPSSMKKPVTLNGVRDSLPVWSVVYPEEITDKTLKIESKIAFVSEREQGLQQTYYVYLSRKYESTVELISQEGRGYVNSPDEIAKKIVDEKDNSIVEGDYPTFTGDGRSLIFEKSDGDNNFLMRYDFIAKNFSKMSIDDGATKPAGMKNMITNFTATPVNGNELQLKWDNYTKNEINYEIQYRAKGTLETKFGYSVSNNVIIRGLEMDTEYYVKVCIIEDDVEEATTQNKLIKMPAVVAKPSFEIDKDNPYLVKFHAWKPSVETDWIFTWKIDNTELKGDSEGNLTYQYATSGSKIVTLLASKDATNKVSNSSDLKFDIVTDIEPVIDYELPEDSSYIKLSALKSYGTNIDFNSATWTISGAGNVPITTQGANDVIVSLNGFLHKISVNLKLNRRAINGQVDSLQVNKIIDLDFKEIKPVITTESDSKNNRLIKFSGNDSIGNIDWYRAKWAIYANGSLLYNTEGASSFNYEFPETNKQTVYNVSLTLPRKNDGKTETVSQLVSVEPCPIVPKINYEILTLKEGTVVKGAKIIFNCANSEGDNIDYSQARWTVPVIGNSESALQIGATAIYNVFFEAGKNPIVEVSLTLSRRGGAEVKTVTQVINIRAGEVTKTNIDVQWDIKDIITGKTVTLNALGSSGANIEWEKTEWVIDGQYTRKGPIVRIDIPANEQKTTLSYVCTIYRTGMEPIIKKDSRDIDGIVFTPFIKTNKVSGEQNNLYELSVRDTKGMNIDWDKTMWYIYDGNEGVVQKQGATINHAFAIKSDKLGYSVMVEMFLKGSGYPFVGYATIDVEGDKLEPMITWNKQEKGTDPNVITFSAETSKGSNIDWSQAKWSFGDSSETQYGSSVSHKYPIDSKNKDYKVTLTLTRRATNGTTESKTSIKTIEIGSDELKAVVTVLETGSNYLVLSAEDSEGRGLMLDRSVWIFDGDGDSENFSKREQGGVIERWNNDVKGNVYTNIKGEFTLGAQWDLKNGPFIRTSVTAETGAGVSYTGGYNWDNTDYSKYKDNNLSFSSSNIHTGAVCRRSLIDKDGKPKRTVKVTLYIYRMESDGSTKGEAVTVIIVDGKIGGSN